MKSVKWMVAATAVVFATSCGENSSKDTVSTDTVITNADPAPMTVNENACVPDTTTTTTFKTQYPNVNNPQWSRYEPVDNIDWEWSGWPTMDSSDYMVRFNQDNSDYWAWYDSDNNWVGTVSNVKDHKTLPEAVHNVIKKEFDGYEITSVDKEHDRKRTAYEVKLSKGADRARLLVAENGTVIKKKTTIDGEKTKDKM